MSKNENLKTIDCMTCGMPTEVDNGAETVVCGSCMSRVVGAPSTPQVKTGVPKLTKKGLPRKKRGEGKPYVASGRPRGWHFKVFYRHTDGTCYNRGKLITDEALIKQLEN